MLNFKKGSIFSRSAGNEDDYEEYKQETRGACWQSGAAPAVEDHSRRTDCKAPCRQAQKHDSSPLRYVRPHAALHLPTQGSRKQRISGERLGCGHVSDV